MELLLIGLSGLHSFLLLVHGQVFLVLLVIKLVLVLSSELNTLLMVLVAGLL